MENRIRLKSETNKYECNSCNANMIYLGLNTLFKNVNTKLILIVITLKD